MGFEIGKTVAGYEIVEVLGSFKTGVAYKVKNIFAQRFEVLKILPKSIQDDEEQNARFLREIKVHAQLLHPNIVTFYNARDIESQLVMTTEFVPGVTVADLLRNGPIAWGEASAYAGQALAALEYAHAHGIVHRGLSSSNLIVTSEGIVRLTGFGLAKSVSDPQLTAAGTVIGALKYMAPEQVKGDEVDARCDLYSLGIVLYEMLTGKLPFEAKGQFEIMLAHVNTAAKHASDVNPDVPRALGDIVAKALAKAPDDRFRNTREFREAIEQARSTTEGNPVSASPPAPGASVSVLTLSEKPASAVAASPLDGNLNQPVSPVVSSTPELLLNKIDPALPAVEAPSAIETVAASPAPPDACTNEPSSISTELKAATAETKDASRVAVQSPADIPASLFGDFWGINRNTKPPETAPLTAEFEHSSVESREITVLGDSALPVSQPDQTVELIAANAELKEQEPDRPMTELAALHEALEKLPAAVPHALVTQSPMMFDEPSPASTGSPVTLATLPFVETVAEPVTWRQTVPPDWWPKDSKIEPQVAVLNQDAVPASWADAVAAETAIASGESKVASIESPAPIADVTPLSPPIVAEPPEPSPDWWSIASHLQSARSEPPPAELPLPHSGLDTTTPLVSTLATTDGTVNAPPNSQLEAWHSELSTSVDPRSEPSQLELLSAAIESPKPLVDSPIAAATPDFSSPLWVPGAWDAEPAAVEPTHRSPEPASVPAPEPVTATIAETPLAVWTAVPSDPWAPEARVATSGLKPETSGVPASLVTPEPSTNHSLVTTEAAGLSGPRTAPPAPALMPQPIDSQAEASKFVSPSQVLPEVEAVAAAAAVHTPRPIPPAKIANPDLLTALFGDTLLSRLSLILVVCAITFFLGTVTLFAVLSVTKP
jgi:serine/threonine-protein kinase